MPNGLWLRLHAQILYLDMDNHVLCSALNYMCTRYRGIPVPVPTHSTQQSKERRRTYVRARALMSENEMRAKDELVSPPDYPLIVWGRD